MEKQVPGKVKVVKVSEVKPVPVDNATNTYIRVLFSVNEMPTYSMRLFEMDEGGHIQAHKHPWEHEIFVLEGTIKIRVEQDTFILNKEEAIYIPPNKEHEYWNVGNTKARFICVIPVKPTV